MLFLVIHSEVLSFSIAIWNLNYGLYSFKILDTITFLGVGLKKSSRYVTL